ncbi:MAG: hypothetical protein U1G07_15370 [Verrucomicrobiota bacterium]
MAHSQPKSMLTRRQFVRQSVISGGLITLSSSLALGDSSPRSGKTDENPFQYDLSRFQKTPPELLHYEEVGRISSPHPEPARITVGPDDRIYLAASQYVTVFGRNRAVELDLALRNRASCITVNRAGHIYVAMRDVVEVFDRNGQHQGTWPSFPAKTWITGMTSDHGTVFLADAGNRILLKCDETGRLIGRIGAKDPDRGIPGFIIPSPFFDVEMHPDGLLRVTNPGRHRVEAYTVDGDFEMAWGKPTANMEGFCGCCNPINLALTPDGRLVTCEKGLPRVKIYRRDGQLESVVAGPEAFQENVRACSGGPGSDCRRGGLDAAVDSQNRIYVLDLVRADIRVMAHKPNTRPPAENVKPG